MRIGGPSWHLGWMGWFGESGLGFGSWERRRGLVAMGRIKFLFYRGFLLVLAGLSVCRGDWVLGWHSMGLGHFPDIS